MACASTATRAEGLVGSVEGTGDHGRGEKGRRHVGAMADTLDPAFELRPWRWPASSSFDVAVAALMVAGEA